MDTFVIAIAGHSGAGKSTLIEHLVARLGNVNSLSLDQYQESSTYPPAEKRIDDGADPNEFLIPNLDADVRTLKNGQSITHPETGLKIEPAAYLILEEHFGRGRAAIRDLIDFVVYVDIPLEISYIRKLARKTDFLPWEDNPDVFIKNLREHMDWYQWIGRRFYLAVSERVRQNCDLIVDGTLPTEKIAENIVQAIKVR